MTKPRRRDPGQGGLYAYQTKAGEERWYIKLTTDLDGCPKVLVRRKARAWADPARNPKTKGTEPRAGLPFTARWQALAELEAIRAELRAGVYFDRLNPQKVETAMTTEEWLDRWLSQDLDELVAEQRMRASTLASYRKNIRLHIKPEVGHIPLAELTITDIKAMRAHLRDHGRKDHRAGEGLSVRTVNYCAVILQAALTDAVEQGIIATNPALQRSRRGRQGKSNPGVGQPAVHAWTKPQMRTFLTWCESKQVPDHVAFHVLSHTGLRRGELLALRWHDVRVDWKDDSAGKGHLSVARAVSAIRVKGEPERIVEDDTKTGVARSVALDPDTVRLLRRWRLTRSELSLASGRPDRLVSPDALVFGDEDGGYRHPERFSRTFMAKQAQCRRQLQGECPADDLPPIIRLHDLRHSHGSQLYLDGHPLKVIAERLGHDEVVLLRTYTHLSANSQEDMVRRFHASQLGGS